ncbi:MAG: phosphodiesterase [Granulosicoccaceae bacterium]
MIDAIWMSDLHYVAEGDVLGHDPRARLASAIEHINSHITACELCIISGDIVNRGSVEDYAAVSKMLGQLNMPFFPMVGNHDNRELFMQAFTLPGNCMPSFVQYSISTSEGEMICLDTLKVGSDEGEMCKQRLDWLSERLEALGETPAYVFMHHPPMKLGLPMQDTENLVKSDALLDLLAMHVNVKHLFIGHVHRPIAGTIRGIPFATMRSVLYQAPAPLPAWNWQSFKPGEEAPAIGALTIDQSDVTLQYVQFCQYEDGLV